jgi:hypothetical protein
MGKSELDTAYSDWSKRVAKYQTAGIPESVWQPIAQKDLTKTYSQGSTGLTNAEADIAVYSAWRGQSAIQESPRHSGGIFGDISTVLSNIIPDAGELITSLPRGLATLGKELVTPSTYPTIGKDVGTALSDFSSGQYGGGLRELGSTPLLNLLPGVADAADLTTASGRESLLEHPVTAALDVAPIGKGLGLGKVAGGAVRAADEATGGIASRAASTALDKLKLNAKNTALSSIMNRGRLADLSAMDQFSSSKLDSMFKELGDDPEKLVDFTTKARQGDFASMTPEELAVFDKVQAGWGKIQDYHTEQGDLVKLEHGAWPKDSAVVRTYKLRDKQALRVQEAERNVKIEEEGLRRANEGVRGVQAEIGHWKQQMENKQAEIKSYIARVKGPVSSVRRKEIEAGVRRLQGQVGFLQGKVAAAEKKMGVEVRKQQGAVKRLQKSAGELKGQRARLGKADQVHQRAIVRQPPAHLHEKILQDYRKRVAGEYNKQKYPDGAPVEGVAEARQIAEYRGVMKDISVTPFMDRFYDYVGRKEAKAILEDTVTEALKLAKEGVAPVYMPHLKERDMENILSVHYARTKDMTESQVKKKALSMESSVMNMRAGFTDAMKEILWRDTLRNEVYPKAIQPHEQEAGGLFDKVFLPHAERLISKGRRRGVSATALATSLMGKEWSYYDLDRGIREVSGKSRPKSTDKVIPKSMADNLRQFTEGGRADTVLNNRAYQTTMGIFRTSVLYGPRHFAHVVVGSLMPLLLDSPSSISQFPKLWELFKTISQGKTFTGKIDGHELPPAITSHFNSRIDASYKLLQTKVGSRYAELLKDFWAKTGAKPGDKLTQIENAAQSLYQAAVYLNDIKRGGNPMVALEHARKLVVNMDTMSPFERTILKQVFPFYSFTRFATKFLVQLPYDHPLRVAVLSQIANQAYEEWGTGLPQTMMSLFFIGHPTASGDIHTVNLRNMNPFRSITNMFTLGGFMQSLNPILSAPFVAAGLNIMSGTSQMYPEIVYDAQTGDLTTAHPKGDLMQAAEQFVPELGGVDALFGISDNLRSLKSSDQGAFDREIMNMFNIPFAPSQYNLPQTRGRVAENAYKGAENAVTSYKKSGDFAGTIGRYNLIPYHGQLVSPQQFAQYWAQETQTLRSEGYSGSVAAALPTPTTTTTNILAELQSYYGG